MKFPAMYLHLCDAEYREKFKTEYVCFVMMDDFLTQSQRGAMTTWLRQNCCDDFRLASINVWFKDFDDAFKFLLKFNLG